MKKIKILTFTIALSMTLVLVPVGTDIYLADASEAYQKCDSTSGVITATEVNLRTGPATSFDILCKLKKDQKVTVMGKLGDWYAVYLSDTGNVGSVLSKFVKLDKPKDSTSTKQVNTNKNTSTKFTVNNKTTTGSKATGSNKSNVKSNDAKTTVKNNTKAVVKEPKVNLSTDEQQLLDLVNKARKDEGLSSLKIDAELCKVARLKAKDMMEKNYFDHTSKYYGTPFVMMKNFGIKFTAAGENIAGNTSAEKVLKAWLKEKSNNIYNQKFTLTGIGIVDSPNYGKLFVQLFIRK